jgi:hypothetical protein
MVFYLSITFDTAKAIGYIILSSQLKEVREVGLLESSTLKHAVIVSMLLCLTCGFFGTVFPYQYQWRLNFASQHISNAQAFTDAGSQSAEIARAIEALDAFPKEGNFDLWNKDNPATNLATAWNSLYELKGYADRISKLDKGSPEYQIGIKNIQEKIAYFYQNFYGAFDAYLEFGVSGWLITPSMFFGAVWLTVWLFLMVKLFHSRSPHIEAWILNAVLMFSVIAIWSWIHMSPVLYTGPI